MKVCSALSIGKGSFRMFLTFSVELARSVQKRSHIGGQVYLYYSDLHSPSGTFHPTFHSRVFGIWMGYGLYYRGIGSSIPGRGKRFFPSKFPVLALGPTGPPVPWVTVVVSPGLEQSGRKATYSEWRYEFVAWRLHFPHCAFVTSLITCIHRHHLIFTIMSVFIV